MLWCHGLAPLHAVVYQPTSSTYHPAGQVRSGIMASRLCMRCGISNQGQSAIPPLQTSAMHGCRARQLQYFFEAFPARDGLTTYMCASARDAITHEGDLEGARREADRKP